jgi:pyruvate dehydrogenase E1 component subunit alpha
MSKLRSRTQLARRQKGKSSSYEPSRVLMLEIYKLMLLTRKLDEKILSLQRQGRIGPYISCSGEEAAMVASAYALNKEDWMFTSYRELGSHLVRGLSIDLILAQLYGNSNDLLKGRQMSNSWGSKQLNTVPTAAPIGAYLPVAVGVAMASRIRKDEIAVLAYLGDGGTSSSDFHTAMNFAGVSRAPIVFLCRNNGWAISLPVTKQTASGSLAMKASAYGFEGVQVDGNDAKLTYAAAKRALEKARDGKGPTFIEAITYRVGPHSTADDPARYRVDNKELDFWRQRDPIAMLRAKLVSLGDWDDQRDASLKSKYEREIASSIANQESAKRLPAPELIFDDVYGESTWSLKEQRKELAD